MSETEKVQWKISEVAEMIDCNTSTLRFWESEFYWFKPKRSKSGDRRYTKKDIKVLLSIELLVNGIGMTLEGVSQAHVLGYEKILSSIAVLIEEKDLASMNLEDLSLINLGE